MAQKTLQQVVADRPFTEYGTWWPIGDEFLRFMSDAIVSEWHALPGNDGDLGPVRAHVAEYLRTVYGRDARTDLVEDFAGPHPSSPVQSGEFDALSYGFFRSAFELLQARSGERSVEEERRSFTKRVGKAFFSRVSDHLSLRLPSGMEDPESFAAARAAIDAVGAFLKDEGYFRDYVAFRFDVHVPRGSGRIDQTESSVVERLERGGEAYALFEMGYPVILPSAVYLFNTIGEAQHHSSRTMEELFDELGYEARETRDFDPSGFPSDRVVELWEMRKKP